MDETLWAMANIIGPLILLAAMVYVVIRTRRRGQAGPPATDSTEQTERATHHIYEVEEQRRRDGTDGL